MAYLFYPFSCFIEPDDFKEDMLSEIERTNEDTIVNYEKKMGYR